MFFTYFPMNVHGKLFVPSVCWLFMSLVLFGALSRPQACNAAADAAAVAAALCFASSIYIFRIYLYYMTKKLYNVFAVAI